MKTIGFIIVLSFIISLINAQGLHVQGSKLLDADGKEFIFRGINLEHAWFPDKTQFSISEISSLGANSARIVLANGHTWKKTSYSEVEKIINWCENAGLICVLEIHDHTGSDNPSDLKMWAVEYWNEMKNLLNAHKKYVIVNIANEWLGSWNKGSIWAQTYIDVVKILRVIGIQNALMVDASGYGQESGPIIENAKKVLEADPNKNVIFSYHVYSSLGKNKNTLYTAFDKLKNTGVCWIAGEFGWYHQGVYIPYKDLMEYCQKNGIGWLAWSWTGNSGDDSPLDITSVNTFSKNDLSFWGKDIFYGKNGIQNTSKKAYEENNTNFGYCDGCEVTETGSDGTKWGYENGKSCLINTNKCDSSDPGTAPNGFPYCSTCDVTTLTSDGTRWGWENNNSCVINESKC